MSGENHVSGLQSLVLSCELGALPCSSVPSSRELPYLEAIGGGMRLARGGEAGDKGVATALRTQVPSYTRTSVLRTGASLARPEACRVTEFDDSDLAMPLSQAVLT